MGMGLASHQGKRPEEIFNEPETRYYGEQYAHGARA